MQAGKLFEALRDRVVHRSQIGKRKLDRSAIRRELDEALLRLGEQFSALVRAGKLAVPAELSPAVQQVQGLERRLEEQEREIADLEREAPGSTT